MLLVYKVTFEFSFNEGNWNNPKQFPCLRQIGVLDMIGEYFHQKIG